ncbi:MAG: preprotein translocase subunit SecE [Candidatus Shapirobacteria bacterium]|jgi:preprotein translocase subunit SecE
MSKVLQYLREVQVEFKNITWPKKDALIKLTVVVISLSVVISLILGGFDYLFTQSFGLISNLKTQPQAPQNPGALPISITVEPSTPSASLAQSPTKNPAPTILSPQPTKK